MSDYCTCEYKLTCVGRCAEKRIKELEQAEARVERYRKALLLLSETDNKGYAGNGEYAKNVATEALKGD